MMLFILNLLLAVVVTYKVSDFQGQVFKLNNMPSGIYQVNVGLDKFNGLLVGYGDFNSDKSNDIITLSSDRKSIDIQYWEDDSFHPSSVCQGTTCASIPGSIMGIIPADYNYDGLLDLMIVYQAGGTGPFTMYTLLQSEYSGEDYPEFKTGPNQQVTSIAYPFVGDFNGDLSTTVMIIDAVIGRQIYNTQSGEKTPFVKYASNLPQCMDATSSLLTNFSVPIFNAVVDISADCRADLVILSNNTQGQIIEYWYTTDQPDSILNRYCLKHQEQLTDVYIHSMNFVDVNFDGLVDMVTVASPKSNLKEQYLVISYNNYAILSQANICQAQASPDQIVSAYPYELFSITNSQYRVVSQLLDTRGTQFQIYAYQDKPDLLGLFAPFMRFGDFKSTGYPGAIVTLVNQTSINPSTYYIQNVECSACSFLNRTLRNPRQFMFNENPSASHGLNALTLYPSINGAFFDYGENGRLDFLVNVINRTMTDDIYTIQAYYNYLSIDAFFLKVLGLNGFCSSNQDQHITCMGALYYGATYMFSVTDINGVYNSAVGFQLCQSAQTPLQLPYGYMGLGRTNNYIEDFYFGVPLQNGASKKWTPIIPNSQLIVSPHTDDTDNWTISIFIEPTDAILVVVIVTILVLILLGGVIVWKHIKEKEEDKKNQETFFQMFR